jgi:hypothetical protein
MDVEIIPFDAKYLEETLEMMRRWSPDHPELAERGLYDWQHCTRYLALAKGKVIGHIAQLSHEFRHGDGSPPVTLGWGITLVLDTSDDTQRKLAGRGLLKVCEEAPGLKYAAVGVVPTIEPAYLRRGHQIRRDSSNYYARFFRPGKALAYWHRHRALGPAISLANLVRPARTRIRSGTLETIQTFLPEWDAVWDRLMSGRYELYGRRDAAFLNYKLRQPHREYHAFLHRDVSGTVDGYIVYRRAKHRARDMDLVKVCDFVGTPAAPVDQLAEAMRFAREEAVGTYGIVGLSSVNDAPAFRSVGMYVAQPYPVVLAAGVEGRIRVDFFDSDLDDLW